MVHRAPRTSRCLTCTRRKVKCDGERPACKRCQNGGWECAGYRTSAVFIDESARFRDEQTGESASSDIPGSTATSSFAVTQAETSRVSEKRGTQKRLVWASNQGVKGATFRKRQPHPQLPPQSHPQRISIYHVTPDEDVIFLTYFMSRLSCEVLSTQPALLNVVPKTLPISASRPQNSAFQALAAVFYGKHRKDRGVFDKGMRLYSHAMFELRQALQSPTAARELDTLTGALCLCLLENVIFSEPMAWLRHYEGVALLLKLQGRRQCKDEFEVAISRYCRFLAILSAGHLRRPCFLADPEWKDSKEAHDETTPASIDSLMDIFADVPGILHDLDKMQGHDGMGGSTEDFQALRLRTQDILHQLNEWPRRLPGSQPGSPETLGPFPAPGLTVPPESPNDAVALAICDAVLLCLMGPCETLSLPLFPEGGHDFTPNQPEYSFVSPSDYSECARILAVEICHLATSALQGEQSMGMAFGLIFPLQIANSYIDPYSAEAERLESVMDQMVGENHGLEMGKKLPWADISLQQGASELTTRNFLRN